ncbi:hypothetical protein [Hyphococcus sp. DH-69]|uniref:hypothetical protein n=1 Tax=Hyphococcus formosus TaxID=3143534 RepID=UPI00398B638A
MKNAPLIIGVFIAVTGLVVGIRMMNAKSKPGLEERVQNAWTTSAPDVATSNENKAEISAEAIEELRKAIQKDTPSKTVAQEKEISPEATEPKAAQETSEQTAFDYDYAIQLAHAVGDFDKASVLRSCQNSEAFGVARVSSDLAQKMREHCPRRNFEIIVDSAQDKKFGAAGSTKEALDPKLEACRNEARKHIIECAKHTDYQNCEPWGCPDTVTCDKRLTPCDDHDAPFGLSGKFYCDHRNWRNRDQDYGTVVALACPSE